MKPYQKFLQFLPKNVRKAIANKYAIVIGIFVLIILLGRQYGLRTQLKLRKTEQRLLQDKAYYEQEIERAWEEKKDLEENTEKYAREKYKMSKKDEDVFIFEDEK